MSEDPTAHRSPTHGSSGPAGRDAQPPGRLGEMFVALALGVGLAGFLIALNTQPTPTRAELRVRATAPTALRIAPHYTEIERGSLGINAGWKSELRATAEDPTAHYGALPATEHERATALVERDRWRAYRGAPPVVPHQIDQTSTQACIVCHEHGLRVGDVVVPRMSHGVLTNCTQCHAESRGAPPVLASALLSAIGRAGLDPPPQPIAPNSFRGLEEAGPGSRAWPGAPPTIPHSTWMRESCNACHGTLADAGLRVSHPWRTSCTQCHAPSAVFDQMPVPLSPLTALR